MSVYAAATPKPRARESLEEAMRRIFFLIALFGCSSALLAQDPTPGLSVDSVIHEPTASEAGTHLASLSRPNPAYDPLQPTGQSPTVPLIGNGKGLSHVDGVSGEFYALGGTTTHDLCILTNNTGQDIIIDMDYGQPGVTPPSPGALLLVGTRAAKSPEDAPEEPAPDEQAFINFGYAEDVYASTNFINGIVGTNSASVPVQNGSSVAIFLMVIKWARYLDTSPRDYILTFAFTDIASNTEMVFEAKLTVPRAGGSEGEGCVARGSNLPGGLAVAAGGGLAAMVLRRRRLKPAKV